MKGVFYEAHFLILTLVGLMLTACSPSPGPEPKLEPEPEEQSFLPGIIDLTGFPEYTEAWVSYSRNYEDGSVYTSWSMENLTDATEINLDTRRPECMGPAFHGFLDDHPPTQELFETVFADITGPRLEAVTLYEYDEAVWHFDSLSIWPEVPEEYEATAPGEDSGVIVFFANEDGIAKFSGTTTLPDDPDSPGVEFHFAIDAAFAAGWNALTGIIWLDDGTLSIRADIVPLESLTWRSLTWVF